MGILSAACVAGLMPTASADTAKPAAIRQPATVKVCRPAASTTTKSTQAASTNVDVNAYGAIRSMRAPVVNYYGLPSSDADRKFK